VNAVSSTTIEHVIGAEGLFVLHLRSGTVRVRGVDGDAVRVSAEDGSDVESGFEIERGEGSLSMRHHRGIHVRLGRHDAGSPARLAVDIPRRGTLIVDSAGADLAGDDLAGAQRYRTVSGEVVLTRVSGEVAVDAVSGDVEISATGRLRLEVRTVSGDVGVRAGQIDETEVATTSGDIALAGELAPGGRHRIETVSGDALLALAGGTRVEVSTVTGDVTADVPHRAEGGRGRKVLVIGSGRATLSAHSMSGDVTIVAARPLDGRHEADPQDEPANVDPAPSDREPAQTDPSAAAIAAAYDDARLRVLHDLERGDIDVAEATRRLEALDTAHAAGGPHHD
jgi:hypothetical protein